MSLDVEGHEYEVLLSWDFSIPIDVIIIETLGQSQTEKDELCRDILIKNGYVLDIKYKHNEIFILKNRKTVGGRVWRADAMRCDAMRCDAM